MAEFDPDAYLSGGATAVATAPGAAANFDPDAYLGSGSAPTAFDPDEFLKKKSEQSPSIDPWSQVGPAPEWLKNASEAAVETLKGFVPRSAKDVAALLTPAVSSAEELTKTYKIVHDVLGGSTLEDATRKHAPETFLIADADKTPAGSKERFLAGFNVVAQALMAGSIARSLKPKPTAISKASIPDVRTVPDNGTPLAALETAAATTPPAQTMPADGVVGSVPTAEIASRPDLMQFKQMDDTATGLNSADKITAPYDPLKAGNLLLWEPTNPAEYGLTGNEKYIVANGHHRNAAAKDQNIENQNAQIIRESAGYSAGDARALAAEANIADGKGSIYDQVKFIRNEAATHGPDAALERAGQIGARGRKAATVALAAEPDLYASFVNERITPDHAAAIAGAAPNDAALQRLGIDRAIKGDDPQQVGNFLQAVKVGTDGATGTQLDLFGADDSAMTAAINAGKRASAIQREIGEQIQAVAGAAKHPEKAAALGVNVTDPASVNGKLAQLQALRERARNWSNDPQIRDIALQQLDLPASEAVKHLTENPPAEAPSNVPQTDDVAARSVRPTTGVANRVLEAEAKAGHIDPIAAGEGMSWQEMVDSGREQLKAGADPAEIAARFTETGRISADDFAVLRAERERLAVETNQAAEMVRANPNDRTAQKALETARKIETSFVRDVVQPAKTATSDIFRGMQGEAPIDASTLEGMRRAFVDTTGREPKPSEAKRLSRRANEVRAAQRAEASAAERLGKAIDKELPRQFMPKTLEEIRAEMAKMAAELTPCIV